MATLTLLKTRTPEQRMLSAKRALTAAAEAALAKNPEAADIATRALADLNDARRVLSKQQDTTTDR